jgi:hypothetical protein
MLKFNVSILIALVLVISIFSEKTLANSSKVNKTTWTDNTLDENLLFPNLGLKSKSESTIEIKTEINAESPFITTNPTSFTFSDSSETKNLQINTNTEWVLEYDSTNTWLRFDIKKGSNSATIQVSVEKNENPTMRLTPVFIKGGGITRTIYIGQLRKNENFLNVSKDSLFFSNEENTQVVEISSNKTFKITKTESWIKLSQTEGNGKAYVFVKVPKNEVDIVRMGEVVIKTDDYIKRIVIVQDEGIIIIPDPEPEIRLEEFTPKNVEFYFYSDPIAIIWDNLNQKEVTHYKIWRSVNTPDNFELAATIPKNNISTFYNSKFFMDLRYHNENTIYYYSVSAMLNNEIETPKSLSIAYSTYKEDPKQINTTLDSLRRLTITAPEIPHAKMYYMYLYDRDAYNYDYISDSSSTPNLKTSFGVPYGSSYNLELNYKLEESTGKEYSYSLGSKVYYEIDFPDQVTLIHSDTTLEKKKSKTYQLIGFPGKNERTVSELVKLPTSDYKAYRFLNDSSYVELNDTVKPGEGFWLFSNSALNYTYSSEPVLINENGVFKQAVHKGFNIITNPFEFDMIPNFNYFLDIQTPLLTWVPDKNQFSYASDFKRGKAYLFENTTDTDTLNWDYFELYFRNRRINRENLKANSVARISINLKINGEPQLIPLYTYVASYLNNSFAKFEARFPIAPINNSFMYLSDYSDENKEPYFIKYTAESPDGYKIPVVFDLQETSTITLSDYNFGIPSEWERYLIDKETARVIPLNPDSTTIRLPKGKHEFYYVLGSSYFIEEMKEEIIPQQFRLLQNSPNPFNPSTSIQFSLPETMFVELTVFDVIGRLVKTLAKSEFTAGIHQVQFDASSLSSGIYLYRIQSGNQVIVKKMMLVK